jgi:hypothetical protein
VAAGRELEDRVSILCLIKSRRFTAMSADGGSPSSSNIIGQKALRGCA